MNRPIDVRRFAEVGATPAEEVGIALAFGVRALRDGAERVVLQVGLTTDFLHQIAKLRALRAGWARVCEAAGVEAELVIEAEPSLRDWTVYDPWTNLLRSATGTFAGRVGGADRVTPVPFDACLGESDALAGRLAENTVRLLVHEGGLDAPADPAAGSQVMEAWTAEIAAAAWGVLQRLEGADGEFDREVEAVVEGSRQTRRERVAKRLDPIVGTTVHPNLDEARPARSGEGARASERAAEPFERLRAAAEARSPGPRVFLACIGPLAEHGARAQWVRGVYEVAGIRAVDSGPTVSAAECAMAYSRSGDPAAPLAVVCGSDAGYAAHAAEYARALREAGARVVLAGRPKGLELAPGLVDGQVYLGIDVLAALTAELREQGVPGI